MSYKSKFFGEQIDEAVQKVRDGIFALSSDVIKTTGGTIEKGILRFLNGSLIMDDEMNESVLTPNGIRFGFVNRAVELRAASGGGKDLLLSRNNEPITIEGVASPIDENDAVNKKYVDDLFADSDVSVKETAEEAKEIAIEAKEIAEEALPKSSPRGNGSIEWSVSEPHITIKNTETLTRVNPQINLKDADSQMNISPGTIAARNYGYGDASGKDIKFVEIRLNPESSIGVVLDNGTNEGTGLRGVADPTQPLSAANKRYVDNAVNNLAIGAGGLTEEEADKRYLMLNPQADLNGSLGIYGDLYLYPNNAYNTLYCLADGYLEFTICDMQIMMFDGYFHLMDISSGAGILFEPTSDDGGSLTFNSVSIKAPPTGKILEFGNAELKEIADPTEEQSAATKKYVDELFSSIINGNEVQY